jgi:hypothetical protein
VWAVWGWRKTQKLPQKVSDGKMITMNHSCALPSMFIISQNGEQSTVVFALIVAGWLVGG